MEAFGYIRLMENVVELFLAQVQEVQEVLPRR